MKTVTGLSTLALAVLTTGTSLAGEATDGALAPNRLVIHADQGRDRISRNIYGHFSEHLGRCVYEGYWVGEDSPIPNTRGIRNDVVAALRKIKIPVLRWPGGCFADEYHWMDGIGPRAKRPSMINTHWGGVTENNHFGTHEFLDLCAQLGCEPYICGNVGSGTVQELQQWVEYITFGGLSPMTELRRGNMPPEFMYYCFSVLKPFEQGIEKYVNFFKNIENKKFVDNFLRVEKWLGDTPPIPGELFRQWIKDIYQDNLLIQNNMYVGGNHIDLKKIDMPLFTQVAVGDHLVSPECSMPLHYAVGSDDKTLKMYPTGHVGMIASSLSQSKVLPELGKWLAERS